MFSSLVEKFVLTNVVGIVEDWSFLGQSIPSSKSIHWDIIIKYSKKKLYGSIKTRSKLIVVVFAFPNQFSSRSPISQTIQKSKLSELIK